jgi:hypothetical protein
VFVADILKIQLRGFVAKTCCQTILEKGDKSGRHVEND